MYRPYVRPSIRVLFMLIFVAFMLVLGKFAYSAGHTTEIQPPSVPTPTAGRLQLTPRGSDRYLVWSEANTSLGLGSSDIQGLNLKTNQLFTVSNAPNSQLGQRISGSIVVWEDTAQSCPTCDY